MKAFDCLGDGESQFGRAVFTADFLMRCTKQVCNESTWTQLLELAKATQDSDNFLVW